MYACVEAKLPLLLRFAIANSLSIWLAIFISGKHSLKKSEIFE